MPEPTTSTAAVAAGGLATAAAVGEALGIDAQALLWGAAGGLLLLSVQPPMSRLRALIVVAGSSVAAGALTEVLAHWASVYLPAAPPRGLAHGVAFLIGLMAQRALPILIDGLPALRDALLARVRGGQ